MNDYQCNLGFINIFILFDLCFQLYRLWLAELPWELGQLGQFGKVLAKIWPRHSHTQNFLMQSAQKIFQEIGQQANTEPRKACLCWRFTSWILSMSDTASSSLLEKNSKPSHLTMFSFLRARILRRKKCKSCSSSLCLWWNYYLESSLSSWETHSFQVLEQKSRSNEQLSWPALY